jgi:hypothetical protein
MARITASQFTALFDDGPPPRDLKLVSAKRELPKEDAP